jgi:RimJ/RimL family protein N-acetyltransferase
MMASLNIRTPSLFLREFSPEDSGKVFCLSQETGMRDWLPDQVYQDEQNALAVVRYLIEKYKNPGTPAQGPFVLGICLKTNSELIGHVGLSPLGSEVEIGYAIEKKFQGRGYAAQAVAAMSEFAIRQFGLPKILAIVHRENITSCKVLERCGFSLVKETAGQLHDRKGIVRRYEKTTKKNNT